MTALKKIDLIKKNFQESYFRKKTVPKLLSVLFGVIFWLYVMDQVNPEMVRTFPNVPVEILNMESVEAKNFKVLDNTSHLITVKVKGRRKNVMSLKTEDIVLSIDLKNFKKGNNQFPIDRKLYSDFAVIESLSENRIPLRIDSLVKVTKKVEIITTGTMPEGLKLGDLKTSPEFITLSGPESYIDTVDKIYGELDVSLIQGNSNASVPLRLVDTGMNEVKGVTVSQGNVVCTFGVLKSASVLIKPDFTGQLPSHLTITSMKILPEAVDLSGDTNVLSELKQIVTQKIDLSSINQSVELNAMLLIPKGLSMVSGSDTAKITITVDVIEAKEIEYSGADIILKNIPEGYSVKIVDPASTIKVKVKGAKSQLKDIDESNLKLSIECSQLKDGIHTIPIGYEHEFQWPPVLTASPNMIEVIVIKK